MASEGRPILYPYQRRWLADKSRFKAGMFARQTGKTFTSTLEIVLDCLEAEAAGRRERWVILSRGERQAREAMEEGVKRHLQALQAAFEYAENDDWLEAAEIKVLEVRLPGGSRVTALPANPDTARGFSANVLLDEFAFHADSRKIWAALFPVISAGHKLRVISTPNGKGNKFYEIMTDRDPDNPWSQHVVDIHQAVAEGLPRDVGLLRRGLNDPDAWAQEYELQWLDEASAWLSYDLLARIEHDSAGDPEKFTGGPAFIGNDIAARRDLWVGWVWERVGDVLWTREVRVLRRASFAAQAATLDELVARYNPLRIAMDQTGMGEAPTEDARRHGAYRVEGVLFTAAAKQHLATLLKQNAEDRRLRIPADAAIRADLHSLRRVTTPAGHVRFDVHGGDGHADRAWAAALGLYAADAPVEVFDYRPVRKQELTREAAHPTLTGVRQVWNGESMASGLTPERLAALLRSAAEGSQRDFLTLAEEMEERDPHYGAVLGVRKRAVSGLEPTVEAASDEGSDVELADAVREIVKRPEFGEMLDDCLDELGKGYSAVEIIWDRSGSEWRPKRYAWRDPRFFVFDRNDGRTLRLLDEADTFQGIPLEPYKWIVHMPRLKSGLPARGGLARLVALAYMVKAYALTDWVAFAEVFGMPLRLGRYGPGATESDIGKLMRAVANLGTDAAAVLPDTMRIEFEEGGNRAGAGELFEKLAIYLDRQIAKAVLGQTATTEGTPGKLGNEEAQDKVRQDILRSDARQLENTLNRDLVRPFIDLNHGPQKSYPRLLLLVREPEDIQALTAALEKLTPLGLRVEASVIRDKLGLPDPADDGELLGPPVERRNAGPESASNRAAVVHRERIEANAESPSRPDAVEALLDEELEDWEEMVRPLVDPVEKLLSESRDLKQFRDKLAEVISRMDPAQLADLLARAGFATRAAGEAGADLG